MSSSKPKVLVTGAAGQVGGAVLHHLSSDTDLRVVGAGRDPARLEAAGRAAVAVDFENPQSVEIALDGVERLFLVAAYTVEMLRQSKVVVDKAKSAGVRHIVHLGAPGADDTHVGHYAWHQFIERYIEWSGIGFTHLRPEIFMQNLFGYAGVKVAEQGVLRHFVGEARLSWVDTDDIAEVAAVCLGSPQAHAGRTYRIGMMGRAITRSPQPSPRCSANRFATSPRIRTSSCSG